MLWYCNLDEKTRNTWTRLRKALAARYGNKPQPKSFIGPVPGIAQILSVGQLSSVQAERLRNLQMLHQATLRETAPNELRGHVEVFVPETNLWLGFLGYSFGAAGADLSISGNKLGAALVSFVPNPEGKPVQLRIVRAINLSPFVELILRKYFHISQGKCPV